MKPVYIEVANHFFVVGIIAHDKHHALGWGRMIKGTSRNMTSSLADFLMPILVAGGVAAVAAFVGLVQSSALRNQEFRLTAFAVGCLLAFHIVFFLCRRLTDEVTLRLIDYLYLGLALLGIYGALDVEATILKAKIPDIVAVHRVDYRKLTDCTGDVFQRGCNWERDAFRVLDRPYDHLQYRYLLELAKYYFEGGVPNEKQKPLFDTVTALYRHVQSSVYDHTEVHDIIVYMNKLNWFYLLAIGLALRLTKVSIEVFKWHRPKVSSSSTESPKYPRGAHNSLWLRRKLARMAQQNPPMTRRR